MESYGSSVQKTMLLVRTRGCQGELLALLLGESSQLTGNQESQGHPSLMRLVRLVRARLTKWRKISLTEIPHTSLGLLKSPWPKEVARKRLACLAGGGDEMQFVGLRLILILPPFQRPLTPQRVPRQCEVEDIHIQGQGQEGVLLVTMSGRGPTVALTVMVVVVMVVPEAYHS